MSTDSVTASSHGDIARRAELLAKQLLASGNNPDSVAAAYLEISLAIIQTTRGRPMVTRFLANALDLETRLSYADRHAGRA